MYNKYNKYKSKKILFYFTSYHYSIISIVLIAWLYLSKMYNSNINLVTLTILLVNVFDYCYGYFEEKGMQNKF